MAFDPDPMATASNFSLIKIQKVLGHMLGAIIYHLMASHY